MEPKLLNVGKSGVVRPVVAPILSAYFLIYLALLGVGALVAYYFVRLPGMPYQNGYYWYFLVAVEAIVTIYMASLASKIWWIRYTNFYSVGEDFVSIQMGFVTKEADKIPFHNIADVEVISPIVLRVFDIGNIKIETNDGSSHFMHLVKEPGKLAALIGQRTQLVEEEEKEAVEELGAIQKELANKG